MINNGDFLSDPWEVWETSLFFLDWLRGKSHWKNTQNL